MDSTANFWHGCASFQRRGAMRLDIKICGLKKPESVTTAIDGGASHLGFIFFEKSPRNITPQEARALVDLARDRAVCVAVTVDAADGELDAIVETMRPGMLQLHGGETPFRVAAIKARYQLPVIKALSIREPADLNATTPFLGVADRLLLDAKPPKGGELPGGNGTSFDWAMLAGLDLAVDYMLSGGVNASNLEAAILGTNASGIDISSGVESVPGVKDATKISQFLALARRIQQHARERQPKGETA